MLLRELRYGPLENLWREGGGGGRSTKKYSRKGKLNEKKIHARQLALKNIHPMTLARRCHDSKKSSN